MNNCAGKPTFNFDNCECETQKIGLMFTFNIKTSLFVYQAHTLAMDGKPQTYPTSSALSEEMLSTTNLWCGKRSLFSSRFWPIPLQTELPTTFSMLQQRTVTQKLPEPEYLQYGFFRERHKWKCIPECLRVPDFPRMQDGYLRNLKLWAFIDGISSSSLNSKKVRPMFSK